MTGVVGDLWLTHVAKIERSSAVTASKPSAMYDGKAIVADDAPVSPVFDQLNPSL
jgi:hypothetical protein